MLLQKLLKIKICYAFKILELVKNQKCSYQAMAYHFKNVSELNYLKNNITRPWTQIESYSITVLIDRLFISEINIYIK